jgi:hypothetical protein
MNEFKEIRALFHVATDVHDQYIEPFCAMMHTIAARGQGMPLWLYTDNPTRDRNFMQ